MSKPSKNSVVSLGRGFAALGYPRILWILIVSLIVSVIAVFGLWKLLEWLLTGFDIFTWGWANWLLDSFTGIVLFFAVLLTFPAVLLLITSMFLDAVVTAVESEDYPDLPPALGTSVAQDIGYLVKFTLLILVVNLLALPFYLLLPGLNFLISWTINGYICGREYYDLVAMRRLGTEERKQHRARNGGLLFRNGFVLAMLMTVPFLNLLMPVVAAAHMTHVFHAIWASEAQS